MRGAGRMIFVFFLFDMHGMTALRDFAYLFWDLKGEKENIMSQAPVRRIDIHKSIAMLHLFLKERYDSYLDVLAWRTIEHVY